MAEIVNIIPLGSTPEFQEYKEKDLNLIQQYEITTEFGLPEDIIEYHIYDLNNKLIESNINCKSYKLSPTNNDPSDTTSAVLDLFPLEDVKANGIDRGSVNIIYNFFRELLGSSVINRYWIKEISPDRTELKIANQNFSNQELFEKFNQYENEVSNKAYFPDYLLNFGDNITLIGVNLAIATDIDGDNVLLVKLYEALPLNIEVKSTFWVVNKLSEPATFNVSIDVTFEETQNNAPKLRGPNYNIEVKQRVNQTLEEYNYESLFSSQISSSYQQIKSLLEEKGAEINVDYSNFENFIHFSSITDRIYNFKYKIGLLESYSADLTTLENIIPTGNTSIVVSTRDALQNKINTLIEKFDGYEYYLYFESSSTAWPKYTSTKPYELYSITSSQSINWLGSTTTVPSGANLSILYSASYYDNTNKDLFTNGIPGYLKDDSSNLPYETFLNMIGQHFDNIWLYYKDVTERYNASSKLERGISKDLIANTLKGLGINLYTNTNISDNLYYSILGIDPSGLLQPPTGSELIEYYVTSSIPTIAAEDITLEYYKRIYHNLPYLLKTKGTERGLRALINCFGIPSTILRVNEYGGVPKETSYAGYIKDRYSLAYKNDYTSNIAFPWAPSYYQYLATGNANIVPDSIEFRFKTTGIPSNQSYYSQSLFQVGEGAGLKFGVGLNYNPNVDIPSSSYTNYGNLTLYLNGGAGVLSTPPIHLPFFDEEQWWTVLIKREIGSLDAGYGLDNRYWVYVKNAFFNEEGISKVGFQGSGSIFIDGATQPSYNASWMDFNPSEIGSLTAYLGGASNTSIISPDNSNFDGWFQEFRYWATPLPEVVLDKHALDSANYATTSPTGSLFELIFRAPLGNELNVPYRDENQVELNKKDYSLYELGYSTINAASVVETIHPSVEGTFFLPGIGVVGDVNTFLNGGLPYGYGVFSPSNSRIFSPQKFTDLVITPTTAISQKVNNKVIIETSSLGSYPVDTLLNPYVTTQKSYSGRVISNLELEVAFSPADIIDDDMINQLGNFNIDDYIGKPSDRYTVNYVDLEKLKATYFDKYISRYNVWDFVRLLKYIDNSLFKMLKDFVPARASLTTGVIIKSHILERPKIKRFEPTLTRLDKSCSIDIASIEGTPPEGINYETAYSESILTKDGMSYKLQKNYEALYTGEFKGSTLQITDQKFSEYYVSNVKPVDSAIFLPVVRESWYYATYSLNPLLNNVTASRKSTRFYDLDYNTNQVNPTNYNLITYSINEGVSNNAQYNNPYIPWAKIQDSNYSLSSYKLPRYEGSKTISKLYSSYSFGDNSYGQTAAIDKERFQFAYLVDIYTASLTLPSRSNAQIKFLIEDDENVLNLTKQNYNIYNVQTIFKGGETANISLFDYTDPTTVALTNQQIEIYEGGFRYVPILHNISGTLSAISWSFLSPQPSTVIIPGNPNTPPAAACGGDSSLYTNPVNWSLIITPQTSPKRVEVTAYYNLLSSSLPPNCDVDIRLRYRLDAPKSGFCYTPVYSGVTYGYAEITIPAGGTGTGTVTISTNDSAICDPTLLANYVQLLSISTVSGLLGISTQITNTNSYPVTLTIIDYCDNAVNVTLQPYEQATYCLAADVTPTPIPGVTFDEITTCSTCTSTPPTTQTTYITSYNDPVTCLVVPVATSNPSYRNRTVEFSQFVTDNIARNVPIIFNDSYISASNYNIERVTLPFNLSPGDAFHFYMPQQGWLETEEYRVVTAFISGSGPNARYVAILDRPINQNVMKVIPSGIVNGTICRYIIVKHLPDETNVILRYSPLKINITEKEKYHTQYWGYEGMLFPQYIKENIRKNSGNVIKSLKSQNLM